MMTPLNDRLTAEGYRASRRYTRRYAKSFYFASFALPKSKRRAAYAIYAFCRFADNLVDDATMEAGGDGPVRTIQGLRDQLNFVYTHSVRMDPKFLAFRETVVRYRIPQAYFEDLLTGVEMDLTKTRYANFAELQRYCYHVASVVGLIMARVFGYREDMALVHAGELGTGMQLTNILRDVKEDYARGRVYLPQDELRHFGVSERDLASGRMNEHIRALLAFQAGRARSYYVKAADGIPMLTNDGSRFCVRLMSHIYAGILQDIRAHDYDVFNRRAFVPLRKKLWIAILAGSTKDALGESETPEEENTRVSEATGTPQELLAAVPQQQA